MDFTREPIIETVITPKEGCKLVVRSSKSTGQEEYFVDAVEVVSFGHSFFFRSTERPKTFLVPATDYEILEVREARMVLKNVGIDRTIKIAGGREAHMRPVRDSVTGKGEDTYASAEVPPILEPLETQATTQATAKAQELKIDKKRDRRRNYRRRRGRDGLSSDDEKEGLEPPSSTEDIELPDDKFSEGETSPLAQQVVTTSILTSLLPPPPNLISETIAQYKDNILFKDAFYTKEEIRPLKNISGEIEKPVISLKQPEYGSFSISQEDEDEIYKQRKLKQSHESETEEHDSQDPDNPEKEDFPDLPRKFENEAERDSNP